MRETTYACSNYRPHRGADACEGCGFPASQHPPSSARGPLRKVVADICDAAPEPLLRAALRHALAQHGDYTSTDPARLLARLIEDGFAGYRPKPEQIERVRAEINAQWPLCEATGTFTHSAGHKFVQVCNHRAGHTGDHHNGLDGADSLSWPQETT